MGIVKFSVYQGMHTDLRAFNSNLAQNPQVYLPRRRNMKVQFEDSGQLTRWIREFKAIIICRITSLIGGLYCERE